MANQQDRKNQLINELAQARRGIAAHGSSLKASLSVSRRLKDSFRQHKMPWIGGAALFGAVLAWLPSRKRTVRSKHSSTEQAKAIGQTGLLLAGGKLVFEILRPFLLKWAAQRVEPLAAHWMARQSHRDTPRPR